MGILATHAVLFLLVVALRRNSTFMAVVFFGAGGRRRRPAVCGTASPGPGRPACPCSAAARRARGTAPAHLPDQPPPPCPAALVVYNGETLNGLGAEHWRSFSKQPYFDSNGIFYSAVVSAPLMIVMFIILVRPALRGWRGPWPGQAAALPARAGARPPAARVPRPDPARPPLRARAQVNYLLTASGMLVKAKRRELMMKARERARQEQAAEPKKDK
jgi:hypothetical protein